jgi:hypothetical protein
VSSHLDACLPIPPTEARSPHFGCAADPAPTAMG